MALSFQYNGIVKFCAGPLRLGVIATSLVHQDRRNKGVAFCNRTRVRTWLEMPRSSGNARSWGWWCGGRTSRLLGGYHRSDGARRRCMIGKDARTIEVGG